MRICQAPFTSLFECSAVLFHNSGCQFSPQYLNASSETTLRQTEDDVIQDENTPETKVTP